MKFLVTIAPLLALLSACSITVQAPPQPGAPGQSPVAASPNPSPSAPATSPPPLAKTAADQPASVTPAPPSDCIYAPGKAVGGQEVRADLCSVKPTGSRTASFVYYLDNDRINSEVNCSSRTWTTFPEGKVNRPQSAATENMVTLLCDRLNASPSTNTSSGTRTALVFDPPSNVRATPNGTILCSVKEKTSIRILGSEGSWYKTDVCGTPGFIEAGQLRF